MSTVIATAGTPANSSVTTGQSTVSLTTVSVGDIAVAALTVYSTVQITAVASAHATWVQATAPLYNATIGATTHLWLGTVTEAATTANVVLTFSAAIGSTAVQRTIGMLTASLGAGCEWHFGAGSRTNAASTTLTWPALPATCNEVSFYPYAPNGTQASVSASTFAYIGYSVSTPAASPGSTPGYAYFIDTSSDAFAYSLSVPQNSTAAPTAPQASSAVSMSTGVILLPTLAGTPILVESAAGIRASVEIAWAANALDLTGTTWDWTDCTGDVLMDPNTSSSTISISLGSPNETPGQQSQASELKVTLLNSAAQYSLGGISPNWPNVQRNTPVRVRILAAGVWSIEYQGRIASLQPAWDETGRWATAKLTASGPIRQLNQGTLSVRSVLRTYMTSGADPTITNYWPFEETSSATANAPLITSGMLYSTWYWFYLYSLGATTGGYGISHSTSVSKNGASQSFACSAPCSNMPQQQNTNTYAQPQSGQTVIIGNYSGAQVQVLPATTAQVSGNYVGTNNQGDGSILWAVSTNPFITGSGVTPTTSHMYVQYQMDASGATSSINGRLSVIVVSAGTNILSFAPTGNFTDLATIPFRWRLAWSVAGGTTTWTLGILRLGDTAETTSTTTMSSAFTPSSYSYQLIGAPFYQTSAAGYNGSGSFGHIAYHNAVSSLTAYAPYFNAHFGESVVARIQRLCGENGIPILQVVTSGASETSVNAADTQGYQFVDSAANLLRESEATGFGTLYDGLGPGLTYVTRQAKEGQAPVMQLDASAGGLAYVFDPVDDDQNLFNDYTISQRNGPSVSYQQLTGPNGVNTVGDYQSSLTVNVADQTALMNYAQWATNIGTPAGYRYPDLQFALEFHPGSISGWLAMFPSGRLDVVNINSIREQLVSATIPCMVQGWTETIDLFSWHVHANCSSYDPWRVITLAAPTGSTVDTTCWLDTDGSTLAVAALAGATSIAVNTTSGPRWVTTLDSGGADNFPFVISLGGVPVQVTGVQGVGNPQAFTVAPLLQAFPAGVAISIWDPPVQGM